SHVFKAEGDSGPNLIAPHPGNRCLERHVIVRGSTATEADRGFARVRRRGRGRSLAGAEELNAGRSHFETRAGVAVAVLILFLREDSFDKNLRTLRDVLTDVFSLLAPH